MHKLKLLTINLHCLEEPNIKQNQETIVSEIIKRDIDIIFLQEVAQNLKGRKLVEQIKESNYGYDLMQLLKEQNHIYYYYYTPIKESFNKYDEGIAILSKHKLKHVSSEYISKTKDYSNWKSRKMIQAELHIADEIITLVSVHLGWSDGNEVFENQVEKLLSSLKEENQWLLAGDFNVNPNSKEYQFLLNKGLIDLYGLNQEHLYDATHISDMDIHDGSNRIDYFFSTKTYQVLEQEILFQEKRVSDHFGVYLSIKLT